MKSLYSFADSDPHLNIALEYDTFNRLHELAEGVVITYINRPAVVIGKNQNLFEEVNWLNAVERGIDIVRRDSGGGAVFHDLGNLNYSFMTRDHDRALDFEYFLAPVIEFLAGLGLEARIEHDSNLMLGDHKISGNAQAVRKDRVMHHGTLLFDSDTRQLKRSLEVRRDRIDSRAVKSRESEVVNIRERLREQGVAMTMAEFREAFEAFFIGRGFTPAEVDSARVRAAEQACNDKYRTAEWTFGKSPKFSMVRNVTDRAGGNAATVTLQVKRGILTAFSVEAADPAAESFWTPVFARLLDQPVGTETWYAVLDGFAELDAKRLMHRLFDLSRV